MGLISNLIQRGKEGGIARALRHPQYAIFQVGAWSSSMSMWIQRISIGWLTWELTHSGAWLGGIALAQSLPQVFLVAFAGALADRSDRLRILRTVEGINGALVFIIAAVIILDLITIEILLAYVIARGVSGSMGVPARVTIAPTLVPKDDLSAAIAVNSVLTSIASFLGPALAGLLIALWGVGWSLAISGGGAVVMFAVLYIIKPLRTEHREGPGGSMITDIVDGLRYVAQHKGIAPVLMLAVAAAILIRPLNDLLPGIVDVIFSRGADGLAVLMSTFGVGGMIGSIWIANRNRMEGTTQLFLMGTLVALILTFILSVVQSYAVAIGVMAALGVATSMVMNGSQIVVQYSVAGNMRARVMSLYSLNYRAAPSIGAMVMGGASTWVGLQAPISAGAVILLVVWFLIYRQRDKIVGAWQNDRLQAK